MKIHFLGTGASESIPNPFCKCNHCEKTRKIKGRDIRTRSSLLINDELQIDLSPEYNYQVMRDNIDATKIKDLLFTHTHPDHFAAGLLHGRVVEYAFNVDHPLHIYGNDKAMFEAFHAIEECTPDRFVLHPVPPFITIETSSAIKITPLLANHAKLEFCYIYYIEHQGKSLLYGTDTGYFPELTWQWLQGKPLDIAILECTFGLINNEKPDIHLGFEAILAIKDRLLKEKIFNHQSQLLTTHHAHSNGFMYDELVNFFTPHHIEISYDGLIKHI